MTMLTDNRLVDTHKEPKQLRQSPGQSRTAYLTLARLYCATTHRRLSTRPTYAHCHNSFAVRDAMLLTELRFVGLGTFGVGRIAEGYDENSPAIDYLNTGDTYTTTILFVNGRFRVGCWGDIVERGQYD